VETLPYLYEHSLLHCSTVENSVATSLPIALTVSEDLIYIMDMLEKYAP